MRGLERTVADLRADLARDKGGLVRVFADQLEAVLDALEAKPDLVVRVNPKENVSVPLDDPYGFKDKNGLYFVGLTVQTTKRIEAYPSLRIGTEGTIIRHNPNSRYVYGVKFGQFYSIINTATDEIEVAA